MIAVVTVINRKSPVSRELLDDYLGTRFEVEGLGTLWIGKHLPEGVVAWLLSHGSSTASLLGAENPQSKLASVEDNAKKHSAILAECRERGLAFVAAVGSTDAWRENHLLVAGLTREEADDFRQRYDQTAVLHAQVGEAVALVW